MNKEWLLKLKAGDTVVVSGRFQNKHIAKIHHMTPKQAAILVNQFQRDGKTVNVFSNYWLKDGCLVGRDSYSSSCILEATSDLLARIEEENYRHVFLNKLDHLSWADVPLDIIKQVRELVEPYVKKQTK